MKKTVIGSVTKMQDVYFAVARQGMSANCCRDES